MIEAVLEKLRVELNSLNGAIELGDEIPAAVIDGRRVFLPAFSDSQMFWPEVWVWVAPWALFFVARGAGGFRVRFSIASAARFAVEV